MRIGTARPGFVVSATEGNGTLTATGTKSLTIGNGSAPASGAETGDLTVGEGGYTGTLNWNSTGTLKVEGRLRVGDGGDGIINQENGVVTAGDVGGTLKFIAIGNGAGSSGTYNLKNGRFLPGGGTGSGTQLRHLRIGYNGASGTVMVGDGVGAANSASIESTDDLYVGYDGNGSLTMKSDGRILLVGNNDRCSSDSIGQRRHRNAAGRHIPERRRFLDRRQHGCLWHLRNSKRYAAHRFRRRRKFPHRSRWRSRNAASKRQCSSNSRRCADNRRWRGWN